MGLDIRLPIGVFFSLLGLILTIFGFLGPRGIYARSLDINVNLVWGVVLLIFGVAMTALALRAEKARRGQASAGAPPGRGSGRPE
jgi:multisubunit Na+/H+ antiporter MnhG subunit